MSSYACRDASAWRMDTRQQAYRRAQCAEGQRECLAALCAESTSVQAGNRFPLLIGRAEALSISFKMHLLGSRCFDEKRDEQVNDDLPAQLRAAARNL